MTILSATNVTKRFGRFTALDGVNMELKKGEIFGFIGPNGAGKSTAIRVLLGILKATEGDVKIFGLDAWKDAVEIHKRIAYVPGDVNLWPNLDPTKKCRTYSKGNRQKVALIAAFASDADLYILDEPTSGLDPLMEMIFQQCVLDAKKAGKTVLLSSHILSEIEKLCDRVGIIRQGKMIETGTLEELRHLTRTNFFVETKQPVTDLAAIKGVHNIQKQERVLTFQTDADALDAVIKHISSFGIVRLESAPPTLEDLFMRHYEESSDDSGGVS